MDIFLRIDFSRLETNKYSKFHRPMSLNKRFKILILQWNIKNNNLVIIL